MLIPFNVFPLAQIPPFKTAALYESIPNRFHFKSVLQHFINICITTQ